MDLFCIASPHRPLGFRTHPYRDTRQPGGADGGISRLQGTAGDGRNRRRMAAGSRHGAFFARVLQTPRIGLDRTRRRVSESAPVEPSVPGSGQGRPAAAEFSARAQVPRPAVDDQRLYRRRAAVAPGTALGGGPAQAPRPGQVVGNDRARVAVAWIRTGLGQQRGARARIDAPAAGYTGGALAGGARTFSRTRTDDLFAGYPVPARLLWPVQRARAPGHRGPGRLHPRPGASARTGNAAASG